MDWEMEGIVSHRNLMFLIQNYNTNLCLLTKKRCNSRKAWTSHTKRTDNYTIDINWTVNPHWQTLSKHTFNYTDILVRSEMTKCKLIDSLQSIQIFLDAF